MSRDNLTLLTHARVPQLELAQADAQCRRRSAINGRLLHRKVHRRLLGGLGGRHLRVLARRLRRAPTPAQEAVWALVRGRQLGAKFRRWAFVQDGIAFLFCPALMLIVEVDETVDVRARAQPTRDAARDAYLRQLGYLVVRVTSTAILREHDDVVRELQAIIARRRAELAR